MPKLENIMAQNNQSQKTQVATLGIKIADVKKWFGKEDNLERINGIFNNDARQIARFKDSLLVQMSKNPKIANCTTVSIIQCALDIALSGLIPDGRNAHLIPFKDKCTVIFDYKGYVRQILNNHDYVDVKSVIVYTKETFKLEFGDVSVHTQIVDEKKRGEPIGCYSMVKHLSGNRLFCYMSREEIEDVRDNSQGYQMAKKFKKESPWDTNPDEMWKKTVIRRHQKTLKLDADATHMFTVPEIDLYRDLEASNNANYGKPDTESEASVTFDAPEETVTPVEGGESK
jgi:recombination protein RecT